VALELLHNAFLVHDDIEDESEERRGQPTLHALHGVPMAVNVGDALTLTGLRALIDNNARLGPRLTLALLAEAERMARESVEGQAIELGWRRDNALALSDQAYLDMVFKKTCWYTTIFPLRAGALIGTRGAGDPDRFPPLRLLSRRRLPDHRRPAQRRRRPGALRQGARRRSVGGEAHPAADPPPTRVHARRAPPPRRIPRPAAREHHADDVAWVHERLHAYDCLAYTRQVAHALAGAAQHEAESALAGVPPSRDRAFIEALTTWVISRA
jgi:geranylgeranyl diphosphate synthase type II